VVNAIFAIEYGADRIHGTALGIGERVGNAALDQILLNLKLLGELPDHDLTKLVQWCKVASQATRVPIHRCSTRWSAAMRSAPPPACTRRRSSRPRRRATPGSRIGSTPACPPGCSASEQEIEIGHYSGESNVVYWLKKRGYEPTKELVTAVFTAAKRGNRVLADHEVVAVIKEFQKT
jgi:2-isopropylmalate synthase